MDITQQFDAYEITNGKFRKKTNGTLGESVDLGCTGTLSVEPDTQTIVKRCEGRTTKEVIRFNKLDCTFNGHMPVGVLRDVYGLTDKDLATGVYGYGTKSINASGNLTFDVYDLTRENNKKIAFPNISWISGLSFTLENGLDEVATVEVNFSAFADEAGYAYYETFEGTITGWNDNFSTELVSAETPEGT